MYGSGCPIGIERIITKHLRPKEALPRTQGDPSGALIPPSLALPKEYRRAARSSAQISIAPVIGQAAEVRETLRPALHMLGSD